MKFTDLDLRQSYTYADYLQWTFEEAVELIRGKVFKMSSPKLIHQQISFQLTSKLAYHSDLKKCQTFYAPLDVRLPRPPHHHTANDQIDTVVQPDIMVVCDRSKLDDNGIIGAPEWVIEILSPSTFRKDMTLKLEVYEFAGVEEYWMLHPIKQTVLRYVMGPDQCYLPKEVYGIDEVIYPTRFPRLRIELRDIFTSGDMVKEARNGYYSRQEELLVPESLR